MTGLFRVEALGAEHDRSEFHCGTPALDRYLREQASQDMRRRVSTCYVAVDTGSGKIAGFYTLAAGGVPLTGIPEPLMKKLPRYPSLPVARLGRLAVDVACQGRQLGAALLWDAARRALRSEVAVFALLVEAKDETAMAFYRHHGFLAFSGAHRTLMLPLASFALQT